MLAPGEPTSQAPARPRTMVVVLKATSALTVGNSWEAAMNQAASNISEPELQSGPIVVGVDGSAASRRALEWAAQEAEVHGRQVVAVGTYLIPTLVVAAPGFSTEPAGSQELADYCRKVLEAEVAEASHRHPSVRIDAKVVEGPAAQALIEASQRASMLVVGCRGHGGFMGLLLGSVSQQCVTHAHCPVVVIRPLRLAEAAGDKAGPPIGAVAG